MSHPNLSHADAWRSLISHPIWAECYESEEPFIDSLLARCDRLLSMEKAANTSAGSAKPITEIKFEEIRKGDRIRVTRIFPEHKGRQDTSIFTGIADHRDEDSDWCTEEGSFLTIHDGSIEETCELLDRPAPPLPTTPGTIFRATEARGKECDVVMLVAKKQFGSELVYLSSEPICIAHGHPAEAITAWEPIN